MSTTQNASTTPGAFSFFDAKHWEVVKEARRKLGINPDTNLHSHPMLGRIVKDTRTSREYEVEAVSREWSQGFYIMLRLKGVDEAVHRTCVVENISSKAPDILQGLEEFADHFVY